MGQTYIRDTPAKSDIDLGAAENRFHIIVIVKDKVG
jgi:hypothetical protein